MLHNDHELGDVQVAVDAARPNAEVLPIAEGRAAALVHRDDVSIREIDLDQYAERPIRSSTKITVTSALGFNEAVIDRWTSDDTNHPVVYVDEANAGLVAVLNDDGPGGPGWRDHRVSLRLTPTTEWQHWAGRQGLKDQESFARTIQMGEGEIVNPSPATLLEIAQTFHATTSANVRLAKRLRDGRTQIVYEEDQTATAGEGGTLEIPEMFELSMRPFYGSDLWKIQARIEWALKLGTLQIGYQLVRPEDVLRQAFLKMIEAVKDELPGDAVFVEGLPG
jgi:uncharacterized protein YfdQ (DUF2303 family)